jgi:putative spermidine/putrescine transport system substrate-binding protein
MAHALVVLSWRGRWEEALRAAVSDPFERETGIRVEHLPHVGLALPESLSSALNSGGVPPVHIAWSNSVPALQAVDAGHCVPLVPERMAMLRQLRRRAHPEGCSGFPIVHPYVVHYVLGYRRDAVPGAPPKSWNILREKRHQGKIALYPGGNGFYPIAQHMAGGGIHGIPQKMEPCWSYMRQLRDAVGLLDYSIGMEQQFKDRSLDLCFRALPNMLAFADAGAAVNWTVPEEGTTDTLDALWIPQGVPESMIAPAMRYIDFALRPDIQQDWCSRLGVLPVHSDAATPALLKNCAQLPDTADDLRGILYVPERVKALHQLSWEQQFQNIFAHQTGGIYGATGSS